MSTMAMKTKRSKTAAPMPSDTKSSVLAMEQDRQIDSRGIQSIEVGSTLLDVLSKASGAMPLSALSQAAGMTSSKAHRYLASFQRVGLVAQNSVSGHYDLGPKALQLGLAALRRFDIVQQADQALEELRDATNEAVSLTVWGNRGPTIVHWKESSRTFSVRVRLGSVTPLLFSAGGRIFATYLPRVLTAPYIKEEMEDAAFKGRADIHSHADVETMIHQVDKDGLAPVASVLEPGIAAIAAPIFNSGGLVAAMTIVGLDGILDLSKTGAPARMLTATTMRLSKTLGYLPR